MRKIVGIIVGVLLLSSVVLAGQQEALRAKAAVTAGVLASAPGDRDGGKLARDNRALIEKITGALAVQGYFYRGDFADKDPRIYYAEKVSGLEKRLRKKSEELNIKYPELYVPKNLPAAQDADSSIRQLEGAEACIDAGLENGVRFREIHISGERVRKNGREALSSRLLFETTGDGMARFIERVVRREPLETLAELKISRALGGLTGEMRIEESRYDTETLGSFMPDEKKAQDLRASVRLNEEQKESLLHTDFLKTKEEPVAVAAVSRQPTGVQEHPVLVFKGLAKKDGRPCAVIEDTERDAIRYLAVGDQEGGLTMISFSEGGAVVEHMQTKQQEMLKREIE